MKLDQTELYIFDKHCTRIFPADLSTAQSPSILGHKNFCDSDWPANNPQLSSEPIGESCTLLGDMLLIQSNTIQHNTTQRNATQRNATQRNATQCNAMNAIQYNKGLFRTVR